MRLVVLRVVGKSVITLIVYQMYCPPSSSVRVMLPVYSPQSMGWTVNSNFYFPPEDMLSVFGQMQFIRSVSTLNVTGFSWYGFFTMISFLNFFLLSHLISRCYSASGSYPCPLISYSNWSIVIGLFRVNLASALFVHLGLNVTGRLPVDFFLTGNSFWNWDGIEK